MDKKKAKLDFKPITADDIERLTPFFSLRSNKTCDSVFLDSFLWCGLPSARAGQFSG